MKCSSEQNNQKARKGLFVFVQPFKRREFCDIIEPTEMKGCAVEDRLIGNQRINELIADPERLPQAVLLVGPLGCGRNFAARLLAAAHIEQHPEWVMRGIHPDCITVSGQGASGQITIKSVREAMANAAESPAAGRGRAVLIRDCERLNASSANALLKGIEEPVGSVVYILTAEGEASVPQTIRSRCAVYPVCEVAAKQCAEAVGRMAKGAQPADIKKAAELYGGRIGLVYKAVTDKKRMRRLETALLLRSALISRDKAGLMAAAAPLSQREEAQSVISDCMISLERSGEAACLPCEILEEASLALRANMPLALCFAHAAARL